MRIVAGSAKGRRLETPKGVAVRPTTDRVREALFSAISPRLVGASVLDLFAGTGALGIEALSRGAVTAVFVEQSPSTAKLLSRNIETCGVSNKARIIRRDALIALRQLTAQQQKFDLIFLDPPYHGPMLEAVLQSLAGKAIMRENGLIIAEHPAEKPPRMPEELIIVTTKHYGKTILSFIEDN
jgi:16S rRNA (guanine(966)-N(2))-methyltransferase RsmD